MSCVMNLGSVSLRRSSFFHSNFVSSVIMFSRVIRNGSPGIPIAFSTSPGTYFLFFFIKMSHCYMQLTYISFNNRLKLIIPLKNDLPRLLWAMIGSFYSDPGHVVLII